MNLSPGSFYHEGDELTVVNKQQFHCHSPLKAVQYVLKKLYADIGRMGKQEFNGKHKESNMAGLNINSCNVFNFAGNISIFSQFANIKCHLKT